MAGFICSLIAVVFGAALLFSFNPAQSALYPVCFFHKTTGLLCPGCGSLRAMHQLLHGDIVTAMHFNVLLVLSLPILGWFGARFVIDKIKHRPASFRIPALAMWCGLVVLTVFGIVRNLPFAQQAWLAP